MKRSPGILYIFVSAVFWGSAGLFVNTLRNCGISGIGIIFGRAVFTVLLLGAYLAFFDRKSFRVRAADLPLFALTGIVSIMFFNFCYYKTMELTGLSVAATLMYTAPVFVMVISVLFLGERLSAAKAVSCVVAIIGCAFVSGVIGTKTGLNGAGLIFGLCTGLGYSLYGIFSSLLIKRGYGTSTITFYAFVFSAMGSAALAGAQLPDMCLKYVSGTVPLLTTALMALINTIIPYILYSAGLKTVRPSVAIIVATVEPVVATVFDITVYKKYPSVYACIGIILILSAVVFLNVYKNGERKSI